MPVPSARLTKRARDARQIGDRSQAQGIAGRHHQALAAAGETDQLVAARLQQRLVGPLRERARLRLRRRVKTGDRAATLVERADRVHAAAEADVQVQLRVGGGMFAKRGQGIVVAGEQA